MNERAIHIASINREKKGKNSPSDFLIKFNPPLNLDPEMSHSIPLDRLLMIYSWYNIRSTYKNNTLKYSHNGGTNTGRKNGFTSIANLEQIICKCHICLILLNFAT